MAKGSGGTRGAGGGGGSNAQAVEYYVSGEGMWINDYLRGRYDMGELNEQEKRFLNDLDKATSRNIGEEQTLYRSVDASAVFGKISDMEYEGLVNTVGYGSKEKYWKPYADRALSRAQGIRTDKGFMSTTKDESVAASWGGFSGSEKPIVLKMRTNTGTKGRDLTRSDKALNARMGQSEVLLGKGQSYKIGKVYGKNGRIYVDVTLQ